MPTSNKADHLGTGKTGEVDLSKIGEASDGPPPAKHTLLADGLVYTAKYRCEKVREGLVRVVVDGTLLLERMLEAEPAS